MTIAKNLAAVRATIKPGVELVAVSKTHPSSAIEQAYAVGQRIFGESRPQELKAKAEELPKDIVWHMIGHLQTNKVRMIMPYVSLIQSVDSQRLLECISKEAERINRKVDVLLEVHIADEQSKTGWDEAELRSYISTNEWKQLSGVRICGVMAIATNTDDQSVVKRDFCHLTELFKEFKPLFGEQFDTISMGMSDDYPLAQECGSTMVRVGSKIFGYRDYSKL